MEMYFKKMALGNNSLNLVKSDKKILTQNHSKKDEKNNILVIKSTLQF